MGAGAGATYGFFVRSSCSVRTHSRRLWYELKRCESDTSRELLAWLSLNTVIQRITALAACECLRRHGARVNGVIIRRQAYTYSGNGRQSAQSPLDIFRTDLPIFEISHIALFVIDFTHSAWGPGTRGAPSFGFVYPKLKFQRDRFVTLRETTSAVGFRSLGAKKH